MVLTHCNALYKFYIQTYKNWSPLKLLNISKFPNQILSDDETADWDETKSASQEQGLRSQEVSSYTNIIQDVREG